MVVVFIIFFVLLLLDVPLAFTIGIASTVFFLVTPGLPFAIAAQRLVLGTQSYPLLAVPFFVLAGNLMNNTGITRRLLGFSGTLTGHMKGGLAQVAIVLSTLMGGVSGAAVADAAMESRILAPTMFERGYSRGYSVSAIGMSSLITSTIPPSIGLILFGFVGEVSIGKLFAAGILPGLVMMAALMFTAGMIARRRGYPKEHERFVGARGVLKGLVENVWALIFPFILVFGIRFGFFTPTEAGAFAVVYAFLIGKFVYKELTWRRLVEVLRDSVLDIGMIMFIIMASSIFGYIISYENVPQAMASLITGITGNHYVGLLVIIAFLIVAGMFIEPTVNTLLLTPIFLPIGRAFGFDPVQFGIIFMSTITFGSMTPPVGVVLYTACGITNTPVEEYVKESIPFYITIVAVVFLVAFVPQISLWLPHLIYAGR